MAKAKDWYTRMRESKTKDDFETILSNCLKSLSEDADHLIKVRKAKSDKAVAACINEVNNKWIAICNLHDSDSFTEEHPMRGSILHIDGFKAAYVHLHPNRGWYFDMKNHKNNMKDIETRMNAKELAIPVLILYGLTPYTKIKELDLNGLRKEFLTAAYALGTISHSTDPTIVKVSGVYARVLATHMTLIKYWISTNKIDTDDVDLAYDDINKLIAKYDSILAY